MENHRTIGGSSSHDDTGFSLPKLGEPTILWIIHLVVGDVNVWSGMDVSMTLWPGAMCCLKYCVFRPWTRHKLTSPTFSSVCPLVNSQFCFGTSNSIWAMVHNLVKYQAGFANIYKYQRVLPLINQYL